MDRVLMTDVAEKLEGMRRLLVITMWKLFILHTEPVITWIYSMNGI